MAMTEAEAALAPALGIDASKCRMGSTTYGACDGSQASSDAGSSVVSLASLEGEGGEARRRRRAKVVPRSGEPDPRDSMHEWLKRASDQLATPVSSADERSDKEEEGGAPPAPPMRSISSMEDGDDFRV